MEPQNQQPINSDSQSLVQEQQIPPQPQTTAIEPPKKKMNKGLKIALWIGIPVIVVFAIVAIVFTTVFNNNDKMVCSAKYTTQGDASITLYFNEEEIVGYSAINVSYDLDEQQNYSKKIGVQNYLQEFKTMFENDFAGTCKIEYKK